MQKLLNNALVVIILCSLQIFTGGTTYSQQPSENVSLLLEARFVQEEFKDIRPDFLMPRSKNYIIKYNPVTLFLGSMMYVYQGFFSLQFSTGCLYNPSCSQYSSMLIREFGIIKGLFLSADRLSRCNQLAGAQVHPIRINKDDGKVHEATDIYSFKCSTPCNHDH